MKKSNLKKSSARKENSKTSSFDKDNMKKVLEQFPMQCREAVKLGIEIKPKGTVENVLICGMGGSAISGNLMQNAFPDIKIPVYSARDYILPSYAEKNSLVFISSYSGNTEETVSGFHEALKRKSKIVVITSGGELEKLAKKNKVDFIKIPSGIQPRLATSYLFFPMLNVLNNAKVIKFSGDGSEFKNLINYIEKVDFEAMGMKIAKELYGKALIIYASPRYSAAAMKWKTDINENAKIHAFYNIYPEFNHNEINGYVNKNGKFHVVVLRDENEHPRIAKRMDITMGLIKKKGIGVTEMGIEQNPMLTKVISAEYLGVWVGYSLALLYKTDPTPVKIIEDLKKALKK